MWDKMKHPTNVVLKIILYFTIIQIFGLIADYVLLSHHEISSASATTSSFLSIIVSLIFAIALFFILLRFKFRRSVFVWYFISFFFAVILTLNVFFNIYLSLIFAVLLTFLKFKTKFNNVAEIFIYPGIAIILATALNLTYAIILMILMAIYDFFSVRISKHMIFMAESELSQNNFMGLKFDYSAPVSESNVASSQSESEKGSTENVLTIRHTTNKKEINDVHEKNNINSENRVAVLGGGDLAFSLIFSDVVLNSLGMFNAIFTLVFSILGISFLFYISSKNKYYPAIPYLTLFIFSGLLISILV